MSCFSSGVRTMCSGTSYKVITKITNISMQYKLEAILCGMPTIQYSAQRAKLYVHKLFTSRIRRCLVSCACNWVMSALSCRVTYLQFPIQACFFSMLVSQGHSGILGLPNIRHRRLPKIWRGFLYGAYKPGKWLCINSIGKMETRHPVVGSFDSEFPSTYNQCRVMDAWSRKTNVFQETLVFFSEKQPLTVKLSKLCSESFPRLTDQSVVCKLREIWLTGNRWNCALLIWQKIK